MAAFNIKALKSDAQSRLTKVTDDPRRLILLNTGVIVLLNLLVSGINMLLDHQIGNTGGLSGLGTRSILETIQSMFSYLSMLFTPFWSAGFLYSIILLCREYKAEPKTMLEGFRRFPSVILLNLNKLLLTVLAGTAVTYISAYIFMLTPFSAKFSDIITTMYESGSLLMADGTVNLQAISPDVLMQASIPMFIIFFVLFLPVYAFISYSLRLSDYLVMQGQRISGFTAMIMSFRMMKGHRMQMFKLDLSFWWYYVLETLLAVVLYLDMILPLLGITLPYNPALWFFVFLILYSVLQMALHLWKKIPLYMTYVLSYEEITKENQTSSI